MANIIKILGALVALIPAIRDILNMFKKDPEEKVKDRLAKHRERTKEIAEALKDLKKYEAAIKTFDEVTKINIVHLSAHFEKAVIYELLGNYPEAIRRYEVILEIRPRADNVKRKLNKALEKYSEITNVWKNKI